MHGIGTHARSLSQGRPLGHLTRFGLVTKSTVLSWPVVQVMLFSCDIKRRALYSYVMITNSKQMFYHIEHWRSKHFILLNTILYRCEGVTKLP